MAENADVALYLYRRRRGETFVILHDLSAGKGSAGKLKVGARFTGRFYPSRCDLSPDGRHFVYFVMGGAQKTVGQRLYCWTAMSEPPSLTAIFLVPQDDTWGGGGRFLDNRNLVIEAGMHDGVERLAAFHDRSFAGVHVQVKSGYVKLPEAKGLRAAKPQRDGGWRSSLKGKLAPGDREETKSAKRAVLIRKLHPEFVRRGDFASNVYELAGSDNTPLLPPELMARVNWADFDRKGRLLLSVGQEVRIYGKPAPGMGDKPDHVFDLEVATEPG